MGEVKWEEVFRDGWLGKVIRGGVEGNRDLNVGGLKVEEGGGWV